MSSLRSAFDQYTLDEYRDYITYQELARIETVPEFKAILEALTKQEWDDYQYWLRYSTRKEFSMERWRVLLLTLMRRLLGLTFTAKFIELNEKRAVRDYTELLKTAPLEMREKIKHIIEHEKQHEKHMIGQIREEKVEFIGSVVLGLNDALIELTGALLGFSFMFDKRWMVAVTGLVTALAASLSMAASAYMQARQEPGKDAKKAGVYTGVSYWGVAVLLILPYFLTSRVFIAIGGMFLAVLIIIAAISYYTSVIFERKFKRQFLEMLVSSLGVGAAAALIGALLRHFTGG